MIPQSVKEKRRRAKSQLIAEGVCLAYPWRTVLVATKNTQSLVARLARIHEV